jgi:hypothetical protein
MLWSYKHQEFSTKPSGSLDGNPSIMGCPRKKMRSMPQGIGKMGNLKAPTYRGFFFAPRKGHHAQNTS